MTIMSITTYHYFEGIAQDFATVTTVTTSPRFVITSELDYQAGERKLEELARTFNQQIEVRNYENFVVHDITMVLP